jgi:hypothetical protein
MAGHQVLHHDLDIYAVHIHVTRSRKAMRAMRATYGVKFEKQLEVFGLTAVRSRNGVMHACVFIDKDVKGQLLVEIVAHETAHLAGMVFDELDTKITGTSEPFAYLCGWTASCLWRSARELA